MIRHLFAASYLAALIFVAIAAALPAAAHDYRAGNIVVGHPWAHATIGRVPNGAAFLTLRSEGGADSLIAVESDLAARTELHTHIHEDGRMMMRPVDRIDVPAGGEAKLAPGGHHIMLLGLKAPLEAGARLPLTLVFDKAGRIEVEIAVEERAGSDGGGDKHHGHKPE